MWFKHPTYFVDCTSFCRNWNFHGFANDFWFVKVVAGAKFERSDHQRDRYGLPAARCAKTPGHCDR